MGSRTYKRRSGTVSHGEDYEHGMSALLLWRALRRWPDADLATNDATAGSFDDVVLRPSSTDTPISGILIQLKHKGKNFSMEEKDLGSRDKKLLGLVYFFEEFQKLWRNEEAWDILGINKHSTRFVLHTNASLPLEEGPSAEPELVELLSTRITGRAHYLDAKILKRIEKQSRLPKDESVAAELGGQKQKKGKRKDMVLVKGTSVNWEFSEEFLKHFIVFHKQSNETFLSELLRQEIILHCGLLTGLGDECKKFEESVKKENKKEGDVESLSFNYDGYTELLNWIEQQSRLLNGVSVTDSVAADLGGQVQKELEKGNILTVIIPESSSQLRSCIVAQALKTSMEVAIVFTDGNNAKEAIRLWYQEQCMLVVDEKALVQDDTLINELKNAHWLGHLSEKRKLIFLLSRQANNGLFKGLALPPPLFFDVSLADLLPKSRNVLLGAEVSLQGTRQTLREIAPEQVWPELKADTLSLLLHPGLLSLGADLTPSPDHYVERDLRAQVYIDKEVLKDPSVQDYFVIEGMRLEELKNVVHSEYKAADLKDCLRGGFLSPNKWPGIQYFSSKILNEAKIRNTSLPIHTLRRVHKRLLLIDSKGDMTALLKYMKNDDIELIDLQRESTINEKELVERELRRAAVCSDPGTGKSSFLYHSAQRVQALHPHWWIIPVAVNRFYKELKEMQTKGDPSDGDVRRVLELAAGVFEKPTSSLASKLLHNAVWGPGECAIFVDAIDDVAPQYVFGAKAFLSFLDKLPVNMLWITTRPVTNSAVQEALDCCIFSLEKLSLQQQEALFMNICTRPEAQKIARKLLYLLHNNSFLQPNPPITGSPLITAMLGELVNGTEENNPLNSCELSIFEMYCAVIKNSSNGYHKDNLRFDIDNPASQSLLEQLEKQFYQLHFLCALCLLLPGEEFRDIFSEEEINENLELVSKGKEKTGLLVEVLSGKPVFVHRTFAEFFAARWMAESIKIHSNIINMVLKESGVSVVHYFFDMFTTENNSLLLHRAILQGSLGSVGGNVVCNHRHDKDKCGRLPLHLAAREGNTDLVERLLLLGSKVDESDYFNLTPLYYAVNARHWDCVRILVDAGAHVQKDISSHRFVADLKESGVNFDWKAFEADWPAAEGQSFLYAACVVNHEKAILWLIKEYNMKNQVLSHIRSDDLREDMVYLSGLIERPEITNNMEINKKLIAAVQRGKLRLVELYLGQGAIPGAYDAEGETALHHAVRSGKSVIVAALIRRGAPLNAKNRAGETPLMISSPKICTLIKFLEKTKNGNSFALGLKLLPASRNGHLEDIMTLLLLGADTGVRSYPEGLSCLHEAIHGCANTLRSLSRSKDDCALTGESFHGVRAAPMADKNGYYNSVRLLLEEGVDLEAQDKIGNRPIHLALLEKQMSIVKLLVEGRANMETEDENGDRPIHLAASEGHASIVRLLIERGADMEATDKNGDQPIHLAAKMGRTDTVKLLIDRGANVEAMDKVGDRPIHLALSKRYMDIVRLLLEEGSDVEATDGNDNRPIHLAASMGLEDIVRFVIERRADVEAMDKNGNRPIQLAASKGHTDIVRLLIERGAMNQ